MSLCSGAVEILVGDGVPRDLISTVKLEGLVSSATERVSVERLSVASSLNVLRLSALEDDWPAVSSRVEKHIPTHDLLNEVMIGKEIEVGALVRCSRPFPMITCKQECIFDEHQRVPVWKLDVSDKPGSGEEHSTVTVGVFRVSPR